MRAFTLGTKVFWTCQTLAILGMWGVITQGLACSSFSGSTLKNLSREQDMCNKELPPSLWVQCWQRGNDLCSNSLGSHICAYPANRLLDCCLGLVGDCMVLCRPRELAIPCCGTFEVPDTVATNGIREMGA